LKVVANGEEVHLPPGAGLVDLFDHLGVGAKWVVAEINGEAVARRDMPGVRLSEGDRVELVRAVAGG
jgi:sulfur carrier protein